MLCGSLFCHKETYCLIFCIIRQDVAHTVFIMSKKRINGAKTKEIADGDGMGDAVSATEMTGLIPARPATGEEAENSVAILHYRVAGQGNKRT